MTRMLATHSHIIHDSVFCSKDPMPLSKIPIRVYTSIITYTHAYIHITIVANRPDSGGTVPTF